MSISKKLTLAVAAVGLIAILPTFAQAPDPQMGAVDVLVDIDEMGLNEPPPGFEPEMLALDADGPGMGLIAQRIQFRGGGGGLSGLTLTDAQYEQLFALKRDNAGKNAARMGELASASMTLKDLMLQPTLDRTRILAAQARVNALKTELANAKLESRINMLSVLTPEQRTDLRRNMLQRMGGGGGHRGWRGKFMGPGGPGCPMMGPGGDCPPGAKKG